jgi:tetratricopeptide (TPR) repeat protein
MSADAQHFAIQRAISTAAQQLNATQFAEFKRLSKKLVYGPDFQLLLLDCRDEWLRRQLLDCLNPVLDAAGLHAATLTLHTAAQPADDVPSDVAVLEIQLRQLAERSQVIHCLGARTWLDAKQRPGRWDALNIRRERIAEHVPRRLLLWLDAEGIEQLLTLAPDWWAWRAGVYVFSTEPAPMPLRAEEWRPQFDCYEKRPTQVQAGKRIAELRDWLQGELEPELAWRLWQELGDIYSSQNWWDQALEVYQQHVLPLLSTLDDLDVRNIAVTQGRIADILERRGQLEEALRIRRLEELPMYRQRGDIRSHTIAQGKIADILIQSGQFDEALHILQQEVLPVFERQGDIRECAVTKGQIADVLTLRGQFDEALRILQQEELPAYERLGDIRALAVTRGRMADILTTRGQFDEALRIRQQEELPVYEKLGDIRSRAITQSKIADILAQRGQPDEALRIFQQEVLPVFEQLGDMRSRAVLQGKIARILVTEGLLDEALHILQQEVLPVSEQLGDVHGQVIDRANIAVLLWRRNTDGDRSRSAELFTQALQAARQLQIAEVADIEALMHERGLPIPPTAD